MLSPKPSIEFNYLKSRHNSLICRKTIPTIPDPFSTLIHQGNKLKPVSPKMKFPKSNNCLPPRPIRKISTVKKLYSNENERVITPKFNANHSKNSESLSNLKKLRIIKSKLIEIEENEDFNYGYLTIAKIKHANMKSF